MDNRQRLIRQSQVQGGGDFDNLESQLNFMITTSSSYVFTQETPSDEWIITHSLNRFPKVTVIDSEGEVVFASVTYDSINQVTVKFSEPVSGMALLQYVRTYNYVHVQEEPEIYWKIQHDLNRIPEVTVVDEYGTVMYAHVRYKSPDIIEVNFNVPMTGIVYIQ